MAVRPTARKALADLAKKGLTQTQAARKLGVSRQRVSQLKAALGLKFEPVWSRPRPARTPPGKLVQRARLSAGYSYAQLAALSGLYRRNIALIELGQVRRPTERTLRALAKSLKGHVTYDQLVQATPNAPWSAPARKSGPKANAAPGKTKSARKAASRKTQHRRR